MADRPRVDQASTANNAQQRRDIGQDGGTAEADDATQPDGLGSAVFPATAPPESRKAVQDLQGPIVGQIRQPLLASPHPTSGEGNTEMPVAAGRHVEPLQALNRAMPVETDSPDTRPQSVGAAAMTPPAAVSVGGPGAQAVVAGARPEEASLDTSANKEGTRSGLANAMVTGLPVPPEGKRDVTPSLSAALAKSPESPVGTALSNMGAASARPGGPSITAQVTLAVDGESTKAWGDSVLAPEYNLKTGSSPKTSGAVSANAILNISGPKVQPPDESPVLPRGFDPGAVQSRNLRSEALTEAGNLAERFGLQQASRAVATAAQPGSSMSGLATPAEPAAAMLDTTGSSAIEKVPFSSSGLSSATSTVAAQTSSFSATAGGSVHPMAQQVAAGIAKAGEAPGTPVEIALDPPELGRLRMVMGEVSGTITLSITADRPDTADLLRRNMALLAEEFSRVGLDAPSVEISDGSARGSHQRPDDQPSEQPANPQSVDGQAGSTGEVPSASGNLPVGDLDIRL